MPGRVPDDILSRITDVERLDDLSYAALVKLITEDSTNIARFEPNNRCAIDPRDQTRVVYCEKRARRPHDNRPASKFVPPAEKPCVICRGESTRVFDVAPLKNGHKTFLNKNLFPIVYPAGFGQAASFKEPGTLNEPITNAPSFGGHFLQWTSTDHDADFHNLDLDDIQVVLQRLAALEKKLLTAPDSGMPVSDQVPGQEYRGYVGIIKNFGYLVGGSLSHGHQQIAHTNAMPRKILEDVRFKKEHQRGFCPWMLQHNPASLTVREFEHFRWVVPYFMRRPLDSLLLLKSRPVDVSYLHQLDTAELRDLGQALKTLIQAVREAMPLLGKTPTYNLIVHNGPIGGLYFEMLPYTQETGGYEHLGFYVCQGTPELALETYRQTKVV